MTLEIEYMPEMYAAFLALISGYFPSDPILSCFYMNNPGVQFIE